MTSWVYTNKMPEITGYGANVTVIKSRIWTVEPVQTRMKGRTEERESGIFLIFLRNVEAAMRCRSKRIQDNQGEIKFVTRDGRYGLPWYISRKRVRFRR